MPKKKTPETIEKNAIKKYLSIRGYFHFPIMQGLGAYRGIPDIFAIKNGITYAIEVKSVRGRQSDYQKRFQCDWENCGGVYVLGGIDEVMQRLK